MPPSLTKALEACETSLHAAAASATSRTSILLDVSLPAPAALIQALPELPFLAYGDAFGLGVATELRLGDLNPSLATQWAQAQFASLGATAPPVFCGAAFAPRATGAERWRDFPALYLAVPRWTVQPDAAARLTLTLSPSEARSPTGRAQALAELQRILEATVAPDTAIESTPVQMPPTEWNALVRSALDAIASEQFRKLVLARTATVTGAWRAGSIFERLRAATGCTAFAVRLGAVDSAATFLGATPERLIAGGPAGFTTHALAGTRPADDSGTQSLLDSPKNREEHQIVVGELTRRLRPLCAALEVGETAEAARLKDVVHLQTPISGRPVDGVHLLDLACALHPTPAVGGLPGEAAVEWINDHEPALRGWYAGFLGWFNHQGNGAFGVAIRSGVLDGGEACAYAGAGIVAGSDPSAEYQETALKQRSFFRALGLGAEGLSA